MRRFMLCCALLLVFAPPLRAGETDKTAIREAVQRVIRLQNAALRRDDGATAFAHAAPGIRQRFGTPAVFMEMVRASCPQVYRPRETGFRDFAMLGGTPVQRVLHVGQDATTVIAHYAFEAHADGSWRILHVSLRPAKDKAI